MDPIPELPLEIMHAAYNRLTQQELRFKPFERLWADFSRAGYTSADMELVVCYVQAANKRTEYQISLRLNKLLDDLPRFESLRGEADLEARVKAAKARQWLPSSGEQARASMCQHEPVPPETEPRMAREVVLANLEKLKAEIGRQV